MATAKRQELLVPGTSMALVKAEVGLETIMKNLQALKTVRRILEQTTNMELVNELWNVFDEMEADQSIICQYMVQTVNNYKILQQEIDRLKKELALQRDFTSNVNVTVTSQNYCNKTMDKLATDVPQDDIHTPEDNTSNTANTNNEGSELSILPASLLNTINLFLISTIHHNSEVLPAVCSGEMEMTSVAPEDKGDTVTRAEEMRKHQGPHECEVTCGGELDLKRHFNKCEKNPGHTEFIPIDEFTLDHLPPLRRDIDLYNCIRALADLTVRIMVDVISDARPRENSFGSHDMNHSTITGSGWILVVKEYPIWYIKKTCPCNECSNSKTPRKEFAEIVIYTAGHVVYDEVEGRHARCYLNYDEGNRLEDCPNLIELSGLILISSDTKGDRCEMVYVTHDLELADQLNKKVQHYRNLNAKVWYKFSVNTQREDDTVGTKQAPNDPDDYLTIIISHPHGCRKHVSIGHYTEREELEGRDITMYTYTTSTCPGSSGAPVYLVGKTAWGMCEHPHSGNHPLNKKWNFSGYGLF